MQARLRLRRVLQDSKLVVAGPSDSRAQRSSFGSLVRPVITLGENERYNEHEPTTSRTGKRLSGAHRDLVSVLGRRYCLRFRLRHLLSFSDNAEYL